MAKWKDIIEVYRYEQSSDLKLTKLDFQSLYPNNVEKQRVQLVCNVFNEKTVVVLVQKNIKETASFVRNVTKMWNILNIRSISIGYRLKDNDRLPFTDVNDKRLDFLLRMATIFKQMDNSIKGSRIKGLTNETSNALNQTLVGIVDLIKTLLIRGYKYVLPGKISSDRTEDEFGIYRQSSGGNYLISAEQVFSSFQLERVKLFSKLDITTEENRGNDCCSISLEDSEEDLEFVERCFIESSNLNTVERSTLYYICGYVSQKEGIACTDTEDLSLPESEFTQNISRGGLSFPPINLFDLSLYYSFFKLKTRKCCTKIFLEEFDQNHSYTEYDFKDIKSINRRLCNCFFKAFVKNFNNERIEDEREIKRRRISSAR